MENTKIAWADHTANAWRGCSERHLGCKNCYAKALANRFKNNGFGTWGQFGRRDIAGVHVYLDVRKWNCRAVKNGVPERVFWNDMSDLFEDRPDLVEPRRLIFQCVDECQNLIHLFCTKRPENIRDMWTCRDYGQDILHGQGCDYRRNCHLLYSASDQETLEAGWEHFKRCGDLSSVLGISFEPLLGPIKFPSSMYYDSDYPESCILDWCIVGGESGPRRRPCEIEWIESIAEQCEAAGVPLFVKQDSALKPGQQGRIPDRLWAMKQFPEAET